MATSHTVDANSTVVTNLKSKSMSVVRIIDLTIELFFVPVETGDNGRRNV